jgi:outer membrane protein
MNAKIKLTFVAIAATVFVTIASAQKIGHIRLDSLISAMPESKDARAKGTEYYTKLEEQVKVMSGELQSKYEEYQKQAGTMSDLIKQTKEKELQDLQKRIQDFQQQAQSDLQKKNDELSKPIYEKANKAIAAVAKENGYKYILDSSVGTVLYSEPSDDVITLVMKKLGITSLNVPRTTGAPGMTTPGGKK